MEIHTHELLGITGPPNFPTLTDWGNRAPRLLEWLRGDPTPFRLHNPEIGGVGSVGRILAQENGRIAKKIEKYKSEGFPGEPTVWSFSPFPRVHQQLLLSEYRFLAEPSCLFFLSKETPFFFFFLIPRPHKCVSILVQSFKMPGGVVPTNTGDVSRVEAPVTVKGMWSECYLE